MHYAYIHISPCHLEPKTIIQNLDSSYNISKKKDKYIINKGKFTKSNKRKN